MTEEMPGDEVYTDDLAEDDDYDALAAAAAAPTTTRSTA